MRLLVLAGQKRLSGKRFLPTLLSGPTGVAHLLPLYYVIAGLNYAMIFDNFDSALADVVILVVTSFIIFVLAVRFFKWRED